MSNWKQEVLLVFLVPLVGFFSLPARGQLPRRPGDRIGAAQDIPATNFNCAGRAPGYYADVETGCQVYHMCTEGGQQFSYRCPNTTLFQQRMLICAHWYQVNCSRSEQDYNANLLIGQRDRPFVDESEHISIYFSNDQEEPHPLRNPEDLQRLGTHGNGGGRVPNVKFMPSRVPVTNLPQHRPIEVTNRAFETTRPMSPNVKPFVPTSSPTNLQTFHSRAPSSTTRNVQPFTTQYTTHRTTTPIPTTEFLDTTTDYYTTTDFDTTTTDYYDADINNSYNNFIKRFVPYINETSNTVTDTVADTSSTLSLSSRTLERSTKPSTFKVQSSTQPSITEAIFKHDTHLPKEHSNTNGNEQSSNVYHFINRFVPDVNDTIEYKTDDVAVVHQFLKRFNPDEVVPNSNFNNPFNYNQQQNRPSLIDANQNVAMFNLLMPPVQQPSVNLELPQDTEDAIHMESNLLELRFPDPRHAFFIPDNDQQNVAFENVAPIKVSIPRQLSTHQFHPMLFVNSVSDCSKCHPSFIVDTVNCSPCVVIR